MSKNELQDRWEIWNTYLGLANCYARNLKEFKNGRKKGEDKNKLYTDIQELNLQGGILSEKEFFKVTTILMCNLAIDSSSEGKNLRRKTAFTGEKQARPLHDFYYL